jgi:hypothetical protein
MDTFGVLHSEPSFHTASDTARLGGARCSARRRIVLLLEPTARRLCIETDDPRIERYVRTVYGALTGKVSVGSGPLDYGRVFTARLPATVCFNGRDLPDGRVENGERLPSWSSGAYLIDQFVRRSLVLDDDWTSLYGCAFTFDGHAAFVAGAGGAGKTTLGLALAAAGASLAGDEMVLIHRSTKHMTALRRAITIRTDSLARVGDERVRDVVGEFAEPVGDETSGIVALDASRLAPPSAPAPLGAVFLAERGDGVAKLERISTANAAARLTPFLTQPPADLTAVADMADLVAGVTAYRLTLGAPSKTAALVLEGVTA